MGPNGAGKTTLLRCITGLYAYRKGSIELFKEEIGYLPQNFGTYRELSVREADETFFGAEKSAEGDRRRTDTSGSGKGEFN